MWLLIIEFTKIRDLALVNVNIRSGTSISARQYSGLPRSLSVWRGLVPSAYGLVQVTARLFQLLRGIVNDLAFQSWTCLTAKLFEGADLVDLWLPGRPCFSKSQAFSKLRSFEIGVFCVKFCEIAQRNFAFSPLTRHKHGSLSPSLLITVDETNGSRSTDALEQLRNPFQLPKSGSHRLASTPPASHLRYHDRMDRWMALSNFIPRGCGFRLFTSTQMHSIDSRRASHVASGKSSQWKE